MQSITDLYSSVYLTAIGMNTRYHDDDPFDDLDGERPKPKSLFARIKSQCFLAISKIHKPSLKPEQTFWPTGSCGPRDDFIGFR